MPILPSSLISSSSSLCDSIAERMRTIWPSSCSSAAHEPAGAATTSSAGSILMRVLSFVSLFRRFRRVRGAPLRARRGGGGRVARGWAAFVGVATEGARRARGATAHPPPPQPGAWCWPVCTAVAQRPPPRESKRRPFSAVRLFSGGFAAGVVIER